MKCIVTGQDTKVFFRNHPVSRGGRFRLYKERDEILDLLIEQYGYDELPRELAVPMVQLLKPINTRVVLFCYKNNKNPFKVFKVGKYAPKKISKAEAAEIKNG